MNQNEPEKILSASELVEGYEPYSPDIYQSLATLEEQKAAIDWHLMGSLAWNLYETAYKATHDSLTGLPNRLWAKQQLDGWVKSNPGEFSLLYIDLDDFKITNDTLGHDEGDRVLRSAADILRQSVRQLPNPDRPDERPLDVLALNASDSEAARMGGDEFIAFVVENNPELLAIIIKRIHDKLEVAGIKASIGFKIHLPGEGAAELLTAADKSMYGAKERRNKERRKAPKE